MRATLWPLEDAKTLEYENWDPISVKEKKKECYLLSRNVIGFDGGNRLQELWKRQQFGNLADGGFFGFDAEILHNFFAEELQNIVI